MKNYHQEGVTRVARQKTDMAERKVRRYRTIKPKTAVPSIKPGQLRIVPLGGQDGIGEKNMIVIEYNDSAIILDCGFELGIDLPGINYAIPVTDYLKSIRHKIKGYVISHGHMDHIGGLVHIIPEFPAPIYGSRFTIGMVEAQFEKAAERGVIKMPDCHVMDMDGHEKIRMGDFIIELVRVTHAIPESSAIVIDTPVGRLINTGDYRLDPEPLDTKPSDVARLKQLGDEGVLLLMSESTNTSKLGRTPTEHTLQDSFYTLMDGLKGRLVVAAFSTNMNRVQMVINAAHYYGRKVVLDGRSMLAVAEMAVRLGNLKIPKGVLVPMREALNLPDDQLVIICTGGQGEPGAALSRMAVGDHQYIKLKRTDKVVISSTPIPGNEKSYSRIGDDLAGLGVKQFRHPTHEIDGSGPLHVSGHGNRDESAEMIKLTRPNYLMPIYGGALPRLYHQQIGLSENLPLNNIIMADNGEVIEFGPGRHPRKAGRVVAGSLLVDQTGAVVPEIVTKDRLLLQEGGILTVVLTIDKKTGRMLTSPDIVTRGHVAVKDNAGIMDELRGQLRRLMATRKRINSRADIDTLKQDVKAMLARAIYDKTRQTPIVIPVINVVHGSVSNVITRPVADVHS